ncbi:MAG: autotransporter domain-containing protein, partial [Akkermansia sp.]
RHLLRVGMQLPAARDHLQSQRVEGGLRLHEAEEMRRDANDFTETGSDAALHFGSQTLTTFTPGVGARFQCVIGENLYNRTSVLELRALAEFDIGDRRSTLDVSLPGIPHGGRIRSARAGAFGGEFGAGIVIPLGSTEGDLFFDVSWECRGDASSLNGSVGYRVTF